MDIQFTVLMSLYGRDNVEHFSMALDSISMNSVTPDEVVLVVDGPVGQDLENVISRYIGKLPMKIVRLKANVGLGKALNEGLKACSYQWVARFDSDDICREDRFKKQISMIKDNPDLSILGAWIAEFSQSKDLVTAFRRVPQMHRDIVKFAKRRCPFNHMTVFYRKDEVMRYGGYQDDYLYEDYALWVRMLHGGAQARNLPEALVYARTGNGMILRRGGWSYLKSEFVVQSRFYKMGFLNFYEFIRNMMIRVPVRLMGPSLRKYAYRLVRKV